MFEVSVDTTLKIAEVLSILAGGGMVAYRLGRTTQRLEASMELQRNQISELQGEVKGLRALMTQVALQDQRLNILDRRIEEVRQMAERNRPA